MKETIKIMYLSLKFQYRIFRWNVINKILRKGYNWVYSNINLWLHPIEGELICRRKYGDEITMGLLTKNGLVDTIFINDGTYGSRETYIEFHKSTVIGERFIVSGDYHMGDYSTYRGGKWNTRPNTKVLKIKNYKVLENGN